MICPVCDRQVQDGNNFCLYCGSPLISAPVKNAPGQPPVNQQPQPQPQMNQAPPQQPEQPQMNMAPPQAPHQKPQNSNKPLLIAIICLLALLIVGLFLLIIVLNKNDNSGNSTSVVQDDDDDDDEDEDDDDDEKTTAEEVVETASSDSDKKISEKQTENEKATQEKTTEETHIYPDDATAYGGHHYKVYYESMTWQEAEDFCVAQGGHLISINSSVEQDFAVTLSEGDNSRYNVWTGGHLGDNGSWEWTDGSSFSYSNWDVWYYNDDGTCVLKPDNYTGSEYVIRFPNKTVEFEDWTTNVGKWDDSMNDPDLGTETFCFICEWSE